jgi:uroporphyrinogen-III synthase
MKRALYLGLDPSRYTTEKQLIHYPIITIQNYPYEGKIEQYFQEIASFSVILLTSRTATSLFFEYCNKAGMSKKELAKKLYIAVGRATAEMLPHALVAKEECGEGIVALLDSLPSIKSRKFFFPHSRYSRPVISDYLKNKDYSFVECIFYEPQTTKEPLPCDLETVDEIIFTSPSTVHAFFEKKYRVSQRLELTTIGPITHNTLLKYLE